MRGVVSMDDGEVVRSVTVSDGPTAVQITSVDLFGDSRTEQFYRPGEYKLVRVANGGDSR